MNLLSKLSARATDCFAPEPQRMPPLRILLVDDDPYLCHLSADVLIRNGFEVNAVEDGIIGWEELQSHFYHLLITEYALPKFPDGQWVEKLQTTRLFVPVVVRPGTLPKAEYHHLKSLQPVATLHRPYTSDELLTTVRNVLHTTPEVPTAAARTS